MKLKKLMAFFVSVIFIFSTLAVSAEYIDVENESLEMRINILEQLNIIEGFDDATFRPDETVTRGEFARYAAKLLAVTESDKNYFEDVAENTENAGYINALKEAGAVSGDGKNFFPDSQITESDAVIILLRGLGYGQMCEMTGGYPSGYLYIANRLDIIAVTAPLTRKSAVRIIYDTLVSQTFETTSMSKNEVTSSLSDVLVAEKYLDLKLIEGMMTYNGYASTDGSLNTKEDFIIVDGEVIHLDGKDVMEYLGFNVVVFAYSSDGSDYHLRAISADYRKNNVITVFAEDIENVSQECVMRIENNSSYKNYSLSGCVLIYNGQYLSSFSPELLKPEEGYVHLIDNDTDSKIDTVIVYALSNDVIKNINPDAEIIYLETNSMISYKDKETVVYIDGVRKAVEDLSESMSISYCESSEFITLWASANKISGLLSVVSDEYITIAGESIKISDDIYIEGNSMKVGKFYTAYINHYGKIIRLSLDAQGDHYGYLLYINCDDGESDDVNVKLISDTGAVTYMVIKDKVRINGSLVKATATGMKNSGITDASGKTVNQLIKYNADDEGRITSISQAEDHTAEGIFNEGFSLDKRVRNTSTRIYRYNVGINYHLGAESIIFYLPLESEMDIANDTDYAIGSLNTFSNDVYMSDFDVYDTKPDRTIGVFVVRRSIQPASVSDELTEPLMKRALGVVTNNKIAYDNEADEQVAMLDMLTTGKAISIKPRVTDLSNSAQDNWSYSKTPVTELGEGDILIYSKNEKDEIDAYTILFKGTELGEMKFGERVPSVVSRYENNDVELTPLHTVFGEVIDINGSTYSINVTEERNVSPDKGEQRHIVTTTASKVYIMDYLYGEHRVGEVSDINVGDIVFARLYNYVPNEIVVFKGK